MVDRRTGSKGPVLMEDRIGPTVRTTRRVTILGFKVLQNPHRPLQQVTFSLMKAQLEQLYELITSAAPIFSLMVERGNFILALTSRGKVKYWIIDSGATYHMTGCENLFHSYSQYTGNFKVKLTNGSFAPVAGFGTIRLSPYVKLKSVLYVPNLFCNLFN